MQLSTLALVSLLSSSAFGLSELCNDPRVKKNYGGDCDWFILNEAHKFNMTQIGAVGKGSNICRTLSHLSLIQLDNRVQNINSNKDLLDILCWRCIKDLAEHQPYEFNGMYNVLDDYQKKNLFKRHNMCSAKKKFESTAADTELTEFCKEKKLKDKKEEIKKESAKVENEKIKLAEQRAELEKKKNGNSADSVAFTAACIFIPIMAAAALL